MMPRFRAWDKELKQMVYDVQATYDGLEYSKANKDIDLDVYDWMDCFESWFNDRRFDLMQDTGLKDKNGIEIYEGDIVNITRAGHRGMGGFGSVYYKEMRTTKIIGFSQQEAYGLDFSHTDYKVTLKVIGNIYENPELLEENQNEY